MFQNVKGPRASPPNPSNEYSTDILAKNAVRYITDATHNEKPFFIGVAPVACHNSADNLGNKDAYLPTPKKKYEDTMPLKAPKDKGNFNPEKVSTTFSLSWSKLVVTRGIAPIKLTMFQRSGVNGVWHSDRLNQKQIKRLDEFYQKRIETLQSVDDLIETIINSLKEHKILDNTYIIYSSDNGFHLGQHRLRAGKKSAFEEDINVPLIIRGPGVPKKVKTDVVSSHVDLAPTIMKLAGMEPKDRLDGKAIILGNAQPGPDAHDEYAGVEFWTSSNFQGKYATRNQHESHN